MGEGYDLLQVKIEVRAMGLSQSFKIWYMLREEPLNDLFFMILDKNRYFCESTFGDKMIIRRITNNE